MPKERHIRKFIMLPWLKGLDTCTDEGIMHLLRKGDFLTQADDIVYSLDGSKAKRTGFEYHDNAAITNTPEIKGGFDYWANVSNVKTQKIVVVDGQATSKMWFQAPSGGAWTELAKDATATAPTSVTRAVFEVFNDDLIIAVTCTNSGGLGPLKWDNQESGNTYKPLGGTPPSLKFVRKHQGRLWGAGDPARPDRLHFSSPGNHEEWNGAGDSGGFDIDPGDGDPSGITAIFPSYKGRLIVAKRNSLYQVEGQTPDDYKVTPISKGIGCISHNSCVAIDQDDVYFMSDRGFHSLTVTEKYGDFEGSFLSADIQTSFNSWSKSQLQYSQGTWIPNLNSVIWAVSEAGTRLDKFWLYDVRFKAWYRWTGVNPTALFKVLDNATSRYKAYFGNNVGRLSRTQMEETVAGAEDNYHDYTNTAITQTIETPFLYPDNDPTAIKGLKKLGVWVKMNADVVLTATIRQAGNNTPQELEFESSSSGTAALDLDFVLGSSVLNQADVIRFTPLELPFDGYSTSLQITFTQDGLDEYCSLFGFWVEWEPAGDSQETVGY
jgi:hypothetical protein